MIANFITFLVMLTTDIVTRFKGKADVTFAHY